ncbi:MAG: hypothetical protein CVV27_04305 [Candidatus Melainabacteria bacterium HGW-Melainabacteria-1]|nr:MAG: hypothetical protein CVV27_04305 [Candidatus Melainabacteria bacterium HGW-Melainabacteria-1]
MQEPLPTYSETHQKLVRALAHLAGSQQSYSRPELVRLVRRKYPELSKVDIKPQDHCFNHGSSTSCSCSRSEAALFEKLETSEGGYRYRVLAAEHGPTVNASSRPRLEPAAAAVVGSAFARAPVTPVPHRPGPQQAVSVTLQERPGLLPRLKRWLFGDKTSDKKASVREAVPTGTVLALPPLPVLPPQPAIKASQPASPVLQVMRLPAPDGVQRLMIQHLSLAADQKQHLKLSPAENGVSLELVHLHFCDTVVRELAVTGSEPLEVGFRLLGQSPGNSQIQIHALNAGEWCLLHTSEQRFPVLPEPLPPAQNPLTAVEEAVTAAEEAVTVPELAPAPVPLVIEPVSVPVVEAPPSPPIDPMAWLSEIPALYHPLLLHIETHGSLSETAMTGLLGGGNAGARRARAFAVQVDHWHGQLPFEIEVMQTAEGKTYRKV